MGVEDVIATCGRWLKVCQPTIAGALASGGFYLLGSSVIEATRMEEIVFPAQLFFGKAVLSACSGVIAYAVMDVAANAKLFVNIDAGWRKPAMALTRQHGKKIKRMATYHPGVLALGTLAATQYHQLGQAISHWIGSGTTLEDARFLARFATQAIGATVLLQTAMPFLDPETRQAYWHSARSSFHLDRKRYPEAISAAKRACKTLDSKLSRLMLGECYAAHGKPGDHELAMREINMAFARPDQDDPLFEYAKRNRIRWLLERWKVVRTYRRLMRQERSATVSGGLELVMLHYSLGNQHDARETLRRLSLRYPDNRDLRLLHVTSLLEAGMVSEARANLGGVFEDLLREEQKNFRALEESANAVLEYVASEFIRDVVVFKIGKRPAIMAETALLSRIATLIAGHPTYRVPHVLAVIEHGEESCCVMRRAHGMHLEDVNDLDAYCRTAAFTAYLHANLPETLSSLGRRPIVERTEASLHSEHFFSTVGTDAADGIINNYRPVYDAVACMPYASNVDAHPRNFILPPDETLVKIDHEDRGASPICFDVANVMRGRADMEPIIEAYWHGRHAYAKDQADDVHADEAAWERFRLSCLNSVYHRAIAFAASWRAPRLEDRRNKRADILVWGNHAIEKIEHLHPSYFMQYRREYTALRRSFDTIMRRLGSGA